MTISNSLPITFWPTGQSPYGEEQICGIFSDCFSQHVNHNQNLTLQFNHSSALTLNAYLKSDDSLIGSQSMDFLGSDYYQLTIVPNIFVGSESAKIIYFKVFAGATDLATSLTVVIGGTLTYPQFTKNFDLDCSVTIDYTNSENFDDLLYEYSPQPEFQIVIPAQFFDEDNPQDREDLELSNGEIVTLRQTIQQKRMLKTGWMPNELHLALQKILMHDTILIEDEEWRVRDPYETSPVNRYGLKKATVLLTKYNSVQKNTL